jgi:putative tryptophan/tyrosine transport system substrate-binding protein
MRRREFLCLLGGSAAGAWSSLSIAQKVPKRIGLLGSGAATSVITASQVATIKEGLRNNGLIDGRDYVLDARFAAGRYERFSELARELAEAGSAVILTNTIASVRAAQGLTPPVPVVMLSINDPIGTGLIASLAKPGNHTTGLATLNEDLTPKLLEFFRACLPKAASIAALFNPANPTNVKFVEDLHPRANAIGIAVQPAGLNSPDVLDETFSELAVKKPEALLVLSDSGLLDLSDRIAALALAHRLPTFSTSPTLAQFGGLLAYGAPREKLFLRAAYFVKRIFDGANPGDLPVEQPTRIELWINLKTAKTLGLDMPLHLQQLADEVIE